MITHNKVIEDLENDLCKTKGVSTDLETYRWVEWNAGYLSALEHRYGFEITAIMALEVLVRFDEKQKLPILREKKRGQPILILTFYLEEASKRRRNLLLAEMLKRVHRVSEKNTPFFKVLEDTACSWDSYDLTRALRGAYLKGNLIVEPLFKIVQLKASHEAFAPLEALLKNCYYNIRVWSPQADVRKDFVKKHGTELKELVGRLRSTYPSGSLFETIPVVS
jgi:hypothetical protein